MSELGQQLINRVRRLAAETPGFVYPSPDEGEGCRYVRNGEPSCLIGQALWAAGLVDADAEFSTLNEKPFHSLACLLQFPLEKEEIKWLRAAQKYQDNGFSWGEAVDTADRISL